jgi:uncharacterized protein (TIGR02466 family)
MNTSEKKDELAVDRLFSSPVYVIEKPEFLQVTKAVSKKFINKRKTETDLNPMYPVYMTENLNYDSEMLEFANYIAQTAWNILDEQGYAMEMFRTYFTEMWCQEHHTMSLMERHIHGNGAVISGFYFIDCPKNSSKVIFHDSRDGKVITNLPEKDISKATYASNMINFVPKNGMVIFTNASLAHSFTRNESKKPMTFIHFNIAVTPVQAQQLCNTKPAEII